VVPKKAVPVNAKQSYALMTPAVVVKPNKPLTLTVACDSYLWPADRIIFEQGVVGGAYTNFLATSNLASPQVEFTNLPVGAHLQFMAEAQWGTNKADSLVATFSAWALRQLFGVNAGTSNIIFLTFTNQGPLAVDYFRAALWPTNLQVQHTASLKPTTWKAMTNYPGQYSGTPAMTKKGTRVALP
jgi:hypothetical protein